MSTRRGRSDSPLNGAVGYLNRLFSGPGQRDHSKQQWEGTASCQHPEAGHRACPGRGMAPPTHQYRSQMAVGLKHLC